MRFVFDEAKAAQAGALLLRLRGSRMSYIKLLKLMYLADRRSLVESGLPITGARMVSMPHGPVLGEVYDRITWEPDGPNEWSSLIGAPGNYEVELVALDEELDRLSPYEVEVIQDVFEKYGRLDRWALVRLTQELPEWRDPGESVLPIEPRGILAAEGLPDEEIEEVCGQAEALFSMKRAGSVFR